MPSCSGLDRDLDLGADAIGAATKPVLKPRLRSKAAKSADFARAPRALARTAA